MLLNVPNEVLRQILAELTPDDLINTALSCETVYSFCKANGDLERHMKHQKNYTVLNLGLHGMDPIELLEKLNEDWRVAYYVKAVHLKRPKTGPLFARRLHGDVRYLMNTTAYAEEAMLALLEPLLLLLPNLARLRFIDFSRQPPGLKELVKRLNPRTVLPRLEVVEFIKSEKPTEDQIRLREDTSSFKNAFNPWVFLHSVHTLRAENIIWNGTAAYRRFHITTLELIDCSIDTAGLDRFLACCRSLKRFTFDWNLGPCHNGLFDEGGLFAMLTFRCGLTLEYVRITGTLIPFRLMGDYWTLRDVERLKQAHLSFGIFCDAARTWDEWEAVEEPGLPAVKYSLWPFQGFLPRSIEELTIEFRKPRWTSQAIELIDLLITPKPWWRELPLLKSVVFESDKLTAEAIRDLNVLYQEDSETGNLKIEFRSVNV